MKRIVFAVAILLIASVGYTQTRSGAGTKGDAVSIPSIPEGTGTVTYDTGAPADLIRNDVSSGGNLFNTANGNPLEAGNVSAISFYVGQTAGTVNYFSFFPNPPVSTQYFGVSVNAGTFNAFSFTPLAVNSSFLAGVSQYLGFVSASTGGQGFHGGQINWNTSGQFNPYPGENAMVRVTGDILGVPVELQSFNLQ